MQFRSINLKDSWKNKQYKIWEVIIGKSVQFGQLYTNPLREDHNPGCSFFMIDGLLLLNDFAEATKYNCVQAYAKLKNIHYNTALKELNDLDLDRDVVDLVKYETEIMCKCKTVENNYFNLKIETLEK